MLVWPFTFAVLYLIGLPFWPAVAAVIILDLIYGVILWKEEQRHIRTYKEARRALIEELSTVD